MEALLIREVLEAICLRLPIHDVHRCMAVCKSWQQILQENHFWREYLQRNVALANVSDTNLDPLLPFRSTSVYSSIDDDGGNLPHCVFTELPRYLECGIAVPADFKFDNENISDYHSLMQAIGILVTLKNGCEEFTCRCKPEYGYTPAEIIPILIPSESIPSDLDAGTILNSFPFISEVISNLHIENKLGFRPDLAQSKENKLSWKHLENSFQGNKPKRRIPGDVKTTDKCSCFHKPKHLLFSNDSSYQNTKKQKPKAPSFQANLLKCSTGVDQIVLGAKSRRKHSRREIKNARTRANKRATSVKILTKIQSNEQARQDECDDAESSSGFNDEESWETTSSEISDNEEDSYSTMDVKQTECEVVDAEMKFYSWLARIFQPSIVYRLELELIEPGIYLHLTSLSNGYIGGVLAALRREDDWEDEDDFMDMFDDLDYPDFDDLDYPDFNDFGLNYPGDDFENDDENYWLDDDSGDMDSDF